MCRRYLTNVGSPAIGARRRRRRVGARAVLHCRHRPRRRSSAAWRDDAPAINRRCAGNDLASRALDVGRGNRDWDAGHYVQRPAPPAVWDARHRSQEASLGYVWTDGRWRS